MVQLVLGMSERPRPDDAADALAIATWVANTDRPATVAHRPASWTGPPSRRSRAARRGYERAVREALAAERADARTTSAAPPSARGRTRDRVGRGGRRRGRRRFARHRGRRARLPGVRRARRSSRRPSRAAGSSSTRTTSSARTSRRCTASARPRSSGFFTLLLTVNGVGPKVALAIVGSRPTAGPPARDHGPGPGRARRHPGDRQEARRADHLRAQGEGHRGRRLGLRAVRAGGGRERGRDRRRAPGARLFAGGGARGVAGRRWRTSASIRASRNGSRPPCGASFASSASSADAALLDPGRVAGERSVAAGLDRHDRQHRAPGTRRATSDSRCSAPRVRPAAARPSPQARPRRHRRDRRARGRSRSRRPGLVVDHRQHERMQPRRDLRVAVQDRLDVLGVDVRAHDADRRVAPAVDPEERERDGACPRQRPARAGTSGASPSRSRS